MSLANSLLCVSVITCITSLFNACKELMCSLVMNVVYSLCPCVITCVQCVVNPFASVYCTCLRYVQWLIGEGRTRLQWLALRLAVKDDRDISSVNTSSSKHCVRGLGMRLLWFPSFHLIDSIPSFIATCMCTP